MCYDAIRRDSPLVIYSPAMNPSMQASEQDHAAIVAAATDYIEGWLTGDPERMARALHPDLVKREVQPDATVGNFSRDQMVEFTTAGYGRELAQDFTIDVLDVYRDIAAVRVTSVYVDYLHVARFGDEWRLLNVLWQHRASPDAASAI
jgi:hypothetical protein